MPTPILELQQLTVMYDHTPVFQALDLTIVPRQFTALVGPTGGGKSTLLKAILGLLPHRHGTVRLQDHVTVGYVPQREVIDWDFPVTVEQTVLMGRYRQTTFWPWATRTDRRETAALLERLGLSAYAKRPIRALSGGQQQRVFLARALIGKPRLLLLDEPTAGVDLKTQHDILHLLRELNGEGMTILLTTHDLNTVASHIPWVICFNHGIVAQGTPSIVLNAAILRQTYSADMVVVRQGDLTFIANRSLVHRHAGQQPPRQQRSIADGTAG
jgi:zinc/manganese transport system ATP-binding protein/zinc transport system ATP-binding protein